MSSQIFAECASSLSCPHCNTLFTSLIMSYSVSKSSSNIHPRLKIDVEISESAFNASNNLQGSLTRLANVKIASGEICLCRIFETIFSWAVELPVGSAIISSIDSEFLRYQLLLKEMCQLNTGFLPGLLLMQTAHKQYAHFLSFYLLRAGPMASEVSFVLVALFIDDI